MATVAVNKALRKGSEGIKDTPATDAVTTKKTIKDKNTLSTTPVSFASLSYLETQI